MARYNKKYDYKDYFSPKIGENKIMVKIRNAIKTARDRNEITIKTMIVSVKNTEYAILFVYGKETKKPHKMELIGRIKQAIEDSKEVFYNGDSFARFKGKL